MTDSTTQLPVAVIEKQIGEFLLAKTKMTWEPEVDLFASGVVSSLFAMELVVFVESTFGVAVEGADLAIDNFRTVRVMSALVTRLRGGGDGA
ncbi:methoxymalonate biosynthesis acyl carrier protein [Actinacidiphila yanglinensis]|uniref:Methoxymalonate biosynthesis acyl carrier protein n=1 Tax=Actinacidiphila yanglinensis TaxID=310779 RepID=A0A1H6E2G8_9ACTN|nr:phosphopantetheine-binding protein [Actinacidiphila yanglinensis]SEG91820.1 methoxymalonate biosynthesis acyl carrier protein [Actinacidiphila yanglinensis]